MESNPYQRSKQCTKLNNYQNVSILSGSSNQELSKQVATYLGTELVEVDLKVFADGERSVQIKKIEDIKGKQVYIIQSTSNPVNENLVELFFMVSACKRAGAQSVTCAIPYYGYARQERKSHNQAVPISAADVAQILQFLGVNKIITIDIHAPAIQGSVSSQTQFEDYEAGFIGIDFFKNEIEDKSQICIVAPDAGATKRAKAFHKNFEFHGYKDQIGLAMMHKERKQANIVESVTVIGDVKDKICIIVDDMVDTAGTLCKAASELKEKGAKDVYAFITHGIFSGPAADRIRESELKKIVSTDTMKVSKETFDKMGGKLVYVSIDLLLAEIIRRSHQNESTDDIAQIPLYKQD